jgi:tetratricopeptide (TPR) repeat protein
MKKMPESPRNQNIFTGENNINQDMTAEICYKLGVDADCLGNCKLAINYYTKAIELTPCLVLAYINRGTLYADLGNYEQAIVDFTKAIKLAPNFASAYRHRGLVYKKLGNGPQAKIDLNKACSLNKEYCKAIIKL